MKTSGYAPNQTIVGNLHDMQLDLTTWCPKTVYCSCRYCHILMRRKRINNHVKICKFIQRGYPRDSYLLAVTR